MSLDLARPVAIIAWLLMMAAPAAAERRAELVLRGGAIYTMDAARSWASAVAIADGRILYVGDDAAVAAHTGRDTHVIDLGGRMVLPGFHDSHMHPLSGGLRLVRCQLAGARSPEAIHAAVRACAAASEDREWLVGGGWEPSSFAAGRPHRAILDRLVPGRPVYLATEDGDTAWVSSRALAAAGIDASTPDPPGGRIERDPTTGAPTGVLRGAAVSLVRRCIPPPTDAEYREGLRRSLAMANRFGITSVIDASADAAMLEQYRAADRAGALSVRVLASQRVDLGRGAEQVGELGVWAAESLRHLMSAGFP
ncbi:MAG TPA: amidohydrolase family protein, partial [Steroidobacteraceae bacterium]|nr:amidohydrolase family protein [Steroidobacteraceae bacterium]